MAEKKNPTTSQCVTARTLVPPRPRKPDEKAKKNEGSYINHDPAELEKMFLEWGGGWKFTCTLLQLLEKMMKLDTA